MYFVGFYKRFQRGGFESVVGVRDDLKGKLINSRKACKRAGFEFRKLALIFTRQILPNLAHLLFDDMKIINQPFGGRRKRINPRRIGQSAININQFVFIVFEPRQQIETAFSPRGNPVLLGKFLRPRFKMFKAENFRACLRFVFSSEILRSLTICSEFQKIKHFWFLIAFQRTISTVH